MKVMVTGASGFVGYHVAKVLKNNGFNVVIFDQVQPKLDYPFIKGDITKLDDVMRATAGVEVVCHLAAVGDVYLAFKDPMLAVNCNVLGTTNIMEAALQNKVKKIVYASTWEVYGKAQYEPIDEKHPCNPDHPYNITKLAGENIVFSYNKLKGVNAVALRLGTAYGEGLRDNSVFALFINKALDKTPITIQGEGKQFRQFVHAEDIGEAFKLAINLPVNGEAINIVGREKTSIKDLAELVAERLPTEVKHEQARAGDVPSSGVSFKKAEEMLGWKQKVAFKTGLNRLIDYYIEKRKK